MYLLAFAAYTVGILGLVAAVISLRLNPKSWTNRMFSASGVMLSVWAFGMCAVYTMHHSIAAKIPLIIAQVGATILDPLIAGFAMAFARSRLFFDIRMQVPLWIFAAVLVAVDILGGSYAIGVEPTPWGNAFIVETGPRYFAQLVLIILNFAISIGTMTSAFRRSVSRHYRRQVAVVMSLPPFLLLGVVATNLVLPVFGAEHFPSIGVLFWGVAELVMFATILGTDLMANEVSVILRGVQYSDSRPLVVFDDNMTITQMNAAAVAFFSEQNVSRRPQTLRDIVRNDNSYDELKTSLEQNKNESVTLTLSDGLNSITLLPARDKRGDQLGGVITIQTEAGDAVEAGTQYGLSPRETEVLALVLQGFRTEEIAERLFISPGTVKTHIANIHAKVGTSSRPALLAKIMQRR